MKIAILSSAPVSIASLRDALKEYPVLTVCETKEALLDALPEAEALVAQNKGFPYHVIDAAALQRAARLRLIQHHGVSFDATDAAAAARLGIPVAVTTGGNHVSVAEIAFHIMISLAKKAREAQASVEAGVMGRVLCTELAGKTMCVVGVGRIGRALARMARGFDMTVIGVRRSARTDDALQGGFSRVYTIERLHEALAMSDFVVLAVPLNDETFDLIDAPELQVMKPGAMLINMSRGPNVNREALTRALANNRIGGFGADVYWTEPADPQDPLLRDSRVFITPHIGAESIEAITRMSVAAKDNIDRLRDGKPLLNVVNSPVVGRPA